jgi:hypothetical protein
MIMISKVHTSSKSDYLKEVLPSEVNDKMSKKLKPSNKKHPYSFDQKDMADFRIPLATFKQYSSTMKGLNKDC